MSKKNNGINTSGIEVSKKAGVAAFMDLQTAQQSFPTLNELTEDECKVVIYDSQQIDELSGGSIADKVLVESIVVDRNIRSFDEDSEKFLALVESIKSEGLLSPIVIKAHKGSIICISGHRRIAAFKKLGFLTIPAIIKTGSLHETRTMAFMANEIVEEMSVLEKAKEYLRLEKRGLNRSFHHKMSFRL